MADESKHEHKHSHSHDHTQEHDHGPESRHTHGHDHEHPRADEHSHSGSHHPEHGHAHEHDHNHQHGQEHSHGGQHSHGEHLTRFHDPKHAAEYDRRAAAGGIRGDLTEKLIEMLALTGNELVLDLATGTGRVARPLAKRLQSGRVIGVDQAFAMLDVGHQHEDNPVAYCQAAATAHALPFKSNTFDRA